MTSLTLCGGIIEEFNKHTDRLKGENTGGFGPSENRVSVPILYEYEGLDRV